MDTSDRPTTYIAQGAAAFRRSKEEHGKLSNMTHGFPLKVNGIRFQSPEGLYQALKFPSAAEVQREIANQRSGMEAKATAYNHKNFCPDWDAVRVNVMRFTQALRLIQHPAKFGNALLSTNGKPIVEVSTRDPFWGAQPKQNGKILQGTNMLGKILTELRNEYLSHDRDPLLAAQAFLNATPTSHLVINGRQVQLARP